MRRACRSCTEGERDVDTRPASSSTPGSSRLAVRRRMRQPRSCAAANHAESPVPDKLTSPAGEEFLLADASVNRVLVKGVVAVMHARTERLWSTKEGDMFLCADAE